MAACWRAGEVQLFNSHGNFDLEGVDNINACYGGTAALLNTIAWVESSAFDGRYSCSVREDCCLGAEGAVHGVKA